jgi:uncharacterized protein (DUF1330 family)
VKGYIIANIEVRDPIAFERYRAAVAPVIAAQGGRYLIRGGKVTHKEGEMPIKRLVMLEFPSPEAAERFYHGEEYRALLELRTASTVSQVLLVEGYDPG